MDNLTFKQLNKCNISLPNYTKDTLHLRVPIQGSMNISKPVSELQIGGEYKVKLENYVIHEPPNFTLSANWNKGTKPPENIMLIRVNNIMGKMINVTGVGETTNVAWAGWLPQKAITII